MISIQWETLTRKDIEKSLETDPSKDLCYWRHQIFMKYGKNIYKVDIWFFGQLHMHSIQW